MIAVHGALGKLGHLICTEAQKNNTQVLPLFRNSALSLELTPDLTGVIDVSSAEGLHNLIQHMPPRLPLLVGTTGALPWKALKKHAQTAPVAVVPNFSAGVPLLLELLSTAIKMLPQGWDIEVIEVHHNQKKDAPSGTAKRIVTAINKAELEHKNLTSKIPTHSLRVGDTFGEHTVWLCGPGERLEIKHVATQRSVFATGALRWLSWLEKQSPGLIKP